MDASRTLMTAQINFIDDRLSLIHIPLSSYSAFVQPILQLLFPINAGRPSQTSDRARFSALSTLSAGRGPTSGSSLPWQARHPFLNIAINSVECSILCSTALADRYFAPVISQQLRDERPQARERRGSEFTERDRPEISDVDFVAISVEGEGMGAGQRVVELSSPLALAGIPILFITTYFSDYVLVPAASHGQVISALTEQGFVFESTSTSTSNNPNNPFESTTTNMAGHHWSRPSSSSLSTLTSTSFLPQGLFGHHLPPPSPITPPPTTVSELQTRTFNLLEKRDIAPQVLSSVRLVQCAGHKSYRPSSSDSGGRSTSAEAAQDLSLQLGLVKCLTHPPSFLSVTLTGTEPPALLLEEGMLRACFNPRVEQDMEDQVLLYNAQSVLTPIMLDLEALPLEATGIVCGVAARLADGSAAGAGGPVRGGRSGHGSWDEDGSGNGNGGIEMSYLSTARTGTVLVEEIDLADAMRALGIEDT